MILISVNKENQDCPLSRLLGNRRRKKLSRSNRIIEKALIYPPSIIYLAQTRRFLMRSARMQFSNQSKTRKFTFREVVLILQWQKSVVLSKMKRLSPLRMQVHLSQSQSPSPKLILISIYLLKETLSNKFWVDPLKATVLVETSNSIRGCRA